MKHERAVKYYSSLNIIGLTMTDTLPSYTVLRNELAIKLVGQWLGESMAYVTNCGEVSRL